MKYLIKESQYKRLEEISLSRGLFEKEIFGPVVQCLIDEVGIDYIVESIKNILIRYYNFDNDFDKKDRKKINKKITDFIDNLIGDDLYIKGKKLDVLTDPEIIEHIFYLICSNVKNMRSSGRVKYIKYKTSLGNYCYLFFTENKYIGFIEITKNHEMSLLTPTGTYKVSLSALEPLMKGIGYGKDMYLAILNNISVLLSDSFLFEESYNLWTKNLPKYVKFVGFFVEDEEKAIPISYLDEYSIREIVCFVASNNENSIKKII